MNYTLWVLASRASIYKSTPLPELQNKKHKKKEVINKNKGVGRPNSRKILPEMLNYGICFFSSIWIYKSKLWSDGTFNEAEYGLGFWTLSEMLNGSEVLLPSGIKGPDSIGNQLFASHLK